MLNLEDDLIDLLLENQYVITTVVPVYINLINKLSLMVRVLAKK